MKQPILMIEGPKFSGFDFSPLANAGVMMGAASQSVWSRPSGGEPFLINGRRIVLPDKFNKQQSPMNGQEDGDDSEEEKHQHGEDEDEDEHLSHTASTAKSVWDCSIILSKYLEALANRTPGFWSGKRVLELGAGQGIASFSAAALGAERVIITDVDSAVPALQRGVALNGFSAPQVQVTALDWTDRKEAMDRIWNDLLVERPSFSSSSSSSSWSIALAAEEEEKEAAAFIRDQKTQRQQHHQRNQEQEHGRGQLQERKLDYILASDVIWVDYLIPALVETMGDLLQASAKERRDSLLDEKEDHSSERLFNNNEQQRTHEPRTSVTGTSSLRTANNTTGSSPVLLLAYQFRSTRSDQLLFDSLDQLGLRRRKLRLDCPLDDLYGGSEENLSKDDVYLDPRFQQSNLAIWKIWKE